MPSELKCVYCGTKNPRWAKAHVMPRFMGTFKNQPTLQRRVCTECDRAIGECEAVLAKSTIEAVLLKHIGVVGRHKKRSSSPFRRAHSGLGPIRMTAEVPGYEHEVRTEPIGDAHNVDMLPQMVLIDREGNREEIVIADPDCISFAEWRLFVSKLCEGKVKDLDIIGLSEQQSSLVGHVLRKLGRTFDLPGDAVIKPFRGTALVKGSVAYDERYFRALAKIALHYFLLHSQVFDGREQEFDAIRQFVRYGHDDEGNCVAKGKGPVAVDPSGEDRPPYYGHVLRTDISSQGISVRIQPFIGHDYRPDWYEIRLSRKKHAIFLSSEEFGHYYRYLSPEERLKQDYDGVIEEITVAQIINIPGVDGGRRR